MPKLPEPTTQPDSLKKTADVFGLARSIYNKRKALREKGDQLLSDAPHRVRAIVEGIEEEDASTLIPVEPSSPGA